MRRADRLFRIVEFLKARRQVVTAKAIADELEVSVRTVYRDIADLEASGVPIFGEAGVGYQLRRDYMLQPMTFSIEEMEALMLGMQMVESWGDKALGRAANQALDKITSILPPSVQAEIEEHFLLSFATDERAKIIVDFTELRRAIRRKQTLYFSYQRADGAYSKRKVRPLSLVFFGEVWLLLAWCEKREDFRNFRLDRIIELELLEESFRDEVGKTLADYRKIHGV